MFGYGTTCFDVGKHCTCGQIQVFGWNNCSVHVDKMAFSCGPGKAVIFSCFLPNSERD